MPHRALYTYFFDNKGRIVSFGPYPTMSAAMDQFELFYGYRPAGAIAKQPYDSVA